MPGLHDLLKARFISVRQDFYQSLSRLTDDDLPWKPAEGMRTVAELLLEIADKDREVVIWLKTGTWPDDDPPSFDPETANLAEIRAQLDTIRQTTFAYIDSMTEEELEMPIHPPEKWWETLRLTECPRSEVLRNIAAHEWYHTGQLVIYLWMRGDNPESW